MTFKETVYQHCERHLNEKILLAKQAMESAQESANAEKGMMGDKFESFREQMQIERDRHAEQYTKLIHSLSLLNSIHPDIVLKTIGTGALVKTDKSLIFVSVALGKLIINGREIIVLSPSSPLGQVLLGKTTGQSFVFNGNKQVIEEVG